MTAVWIVGFAGLLGVDGRIAEGDDGFYVGVILGTLLGLYIGLRSRLSALELRLRETDSTLAVLVAASRTAEPNPSEACFYARRGARRTSGSDRSRPSPGSACGRSTRFGRV